MTSKEQTAVETASDVETTMPPLDPCYAFSAPNERTVLAKERAIVERNGKRYEGTGDVFLELTPRADIAVRVGEDACS